MSVVKDSTPRARNYPRADVPRKYATREAAESQCAVLARMAYYAKRGRLYVYGPCSSCAAFHIGLDTGRPWHQGRTRHDGHLSYLGVHPDAEHAA